MMAISISDVGPFFDLKIISRTLLKNDSTFPRLRVKSTERRREAQSGAELISPKWLILGAE